MAKAPRRSGPPAVVNLASKYGYHDEQGVSHVHPDKYFELARAKAEIDLCASFGNTVMDGWRCPPTPRHGTETLVLSDVQMKVLNYLSKCDSAVKKALIVERTDLARQTVDDALKVLHENGLAATPPGMERAGYGITDVGRNYLRARGIID